MCLLELRSQKRREASEGVSHEATKDTKKGSRFVLLKAFIFRPIEPGMQMKAASPEA